MEQNSKRKIQRGSGWEEFQRKLRVFIPWQGRQNLRQQAGLIEQPKTSSRSAFSENARQFVSNPFGADLFDGWGHAANGIPSPRVDRVSQARAKTNGPQQPQFIFFEALIRVADSADDPVTNVSLTGDVINHTTAVRIVEQPVDREIPAKNVISRIGKDNAAGASAINIFLVRSERCHFKGMPAMDHKDHAELNADRLGVREDLHDLFGHCACCDVVIRGLEIHHHVAHTAADKVGFVPLAAQFVDYLDRGIRFHPAMIPSSPRGAMSFRGVDFYRIDDLLSEEETLVRDTVRRFVDDKVLPIIEQHFEDATFPSDLIPQMASLGLFGANLPEEYGCANMNNVSYGLVMQELERGDSGLRSFVSVQGALVMYPILEFGSEEQRRYWLPLLAKGTKIGCFGLTEPDHGSDPGGMETRAERTSGGWTLNGTKRWITNGSVADVAIVWAKVGEEVRGFIVETNRPGFQAPEIKRKLSLRASVTSDLIMDDVFVPDENVLPGATGLRAPLMCLNQARFGIAWGAVGSAMAVYDCAVNYTKGRTQFGQPIATFQLVQEKLAHILTEITKAQLVSWRLGRLKDEGKLHFTQTSLAKRNNVWIALEAARLARDLMGANGITLEYPVFRHMCNLESVYTYEGTHNIHTLILGEHITGYPAYK